ncbi:hypothetical protein KKG22_00165 [Patescibacteria group bacterium]|nr:hypothetical protein [Patescibacteria group bacterium]MBU1722090.1 hypothetical protein [Patescibacteria group bacterium]MBU1901370.1 hypothetical protein [Patescibacteria group bacterium]
MILTWLSIGIVPIQAQTSQPQKQETTLTEDKKEEQEYRKAAAAFKNKKFKEAAILFEAFYDKYKKPIGLYNLARSLQELGRPWEYAEILKEYLNISPQERESEIKAWIKSALRTIDERRQAQQLMEKNDYVNAITLLKKVIDTQDGRSDTLSYVLIAECFLKTHHIEKAMFFAKKASELALLQKHTIKTTLLLRRINNSYGQVTFLGNTRKIALNYPSGLNSAELELIANIKRDLSHQIAQTVWMPVGHYKINGVRFSVRGNAQTTITVPSFYQGSITETDITWYKNRQTIGWSLIGAGLIATGLGTWYHMQARERYDETIKRWDNYDPTWETTAEQTSTAQAWAVGFWIAGGFLGAGGATTLLMPDENKHFFSRNVPQHPTLPLSISLEF